MLYVGKRIRLERIMNRQSKNLVLIPMDHGISDGPIPGLVNMAEAVNKVAEGGADTVLMQKGMVQHGLRGYGHDVGLIVHMSASTGAGPDPNNKVLVCTVEEAVKLGADGVSIHVNVGSITEAEQLSEMGQVSDACNEWGMPLLAMMYPRGPNVTNPHDAKVIAHAARAGAELGADIVKTYYSGDVDSFKYVVDGCPVPVIIAGGPRANSDLEFLQMVEGSIKAGGRGVAIGRNTFQHKNPTAFTRALAMIVNEGASAEEAVKVL